ncbi:MAG: EAL domain-containing protein, partial [Gammaproteobacteria bacterium]|nr:EAL domain-containing protein [Gammaproteobacteria bacterium]
MPSFEKASSNSQRALSSRILSQALQQTADIVLVSDDCGVIQYVNPAFERVTGYSGQEVLGQRPKILHSGQHKKDFYQDLWKTISQGEVFRDVIVNRRKDGSLYYEEKTITPLIDHNGNISHFVSTGKDVTERIRAQESLHKLAFYDTLTGLPNRQQLHNDLSRAVSLARRNNQTVAVMFIDLDRFKNINDTLGHYEGDRLLRKVADRIRSSLRNEDTVARNGGDEFIVLLRGPGNAENTAHVAEKLIAELSRPYNLSGNQHCISASIGISFFPDDKNNHQDLLKRADLAMYQAKAAGGNCYRFFSHEMEERVHERMKMEYELHYAVQNNSLAEHYQPQYDCKTGELVGLEVLLRWKHPDRGMVSPKQFISIAEETGDIVKIGERLLTKVCHKIAHWQAVGFNIPQVSINISPRQLLDKDIVITFAKILHSSQIKPEILTLELTESALMQHPENAKEILDELSQLGVKLAIDDFGTGYSSLSYLRCFRFDFIKIDHSFIRDIPG